jgi:CxxC-x17-CxxC domain-containing protein
MAKEINFFAKTNFRNSDKTFGIKIDDRRRHVYVIGKTGMGKTNLVQNMAIQDIHNGSGVAIIDPHGEFAEECLKAVPENRINDVIYFNPADTEYPIAMNVMEQVNNEYRPLIASGLVGVFKKIWADSWGPRLEYLLRNAILALLEYPGATLLGVTRILVDNKYREKVLEKVTDPVIKAFWEEEFTKYNQNFAVEAIAPIQNKIGQFLSSSLIRNIVGQEKSSFSMRDIMDNQKILIMNLSKGRIGEDNSALLGAMMITKIQLSAMERVDIPEADRKDFYLYVDEFQNFATESFANILSEARKYRLNLILAHQYIAQLGETVRDAVMGNVGTMITFRVGAADADFLEKEFEPIFYANDLVNLAKYNIYLKLMIDGVATTPFSAVTLPPIDIGENRVDIRRIVDASRKRYAHSREEVEDSINKWRGYLNPMAKNKISELATKGVDEKKQQKTAKKDKKENLKQLDESTTLNQAVQGTAPNHSVQGKTPNHSVQGKTPNHSVQGKKKENKNSIKDSSSENKKEKKEKTEERPLFEAECSACGTEVQVPFKPDGKRPVFCSECLKEYRRQQSKLQNEVEESGEKTEAAKGDNLENKTDADKKGDESLGEMIKKAMEEK